MKYGTSIDGIVFALVAGYVLILGVLSCFRTWWGDRSSARDGGPG